MKRLLVAVLVAALLACGVSALAESDYTYFPESEEYVGIWYVDDYILEIVHMDDDYNLFNCIVTQYEGGNKGVRWIYDACSYDDVGKALASLEIGRKFEVTFDDFGELVSSDPVFFTDGAACFALNEDGTLTWTDFKETPGENEKVFQKVTEDIGDSANDYEGTWVCGRATIVIEDLDDIIYCTVLWSSSACEVSEWSYEGCQWEVEGQRLVSQPNGVRTNLVYGEDGEVESSERVYEDGEAAFVFDGAGYLSWEDGKENAGDGMLFEKVSDYEEEIPAEELAEGWIKVICGVEQGTAGASLKQAVAASELCRFAADQDLSEVDEANVSVCILTALMDFEEDEFVAFEENFEPVAQLVDACFEDWDANRGAFEDAGVADEMESLVSDAAVRQNWEKLRDGTRSLLEQIEED